MESSNIVNNPNQETVLTNNWRKKDWYRKPITVFFIFNIKVINMAGHREKSRNKIIIKVEQPIEKEILEPKKKKKFLKQWQKILKYI